MSMQVFMASRHPALSDSEHTECSEQWRRVYQQICRGGYGDFFPEQYYLEESHRAELAKSGISPVQAAAAGILSLGGEWLEFLQLNVPLSERVLCFLYFDPFEGLYTWLDAVHRKIPFVRAKLNQQRGSQKYTQAARSGSFPYFPLMPVGAKWNTWASAANLSESGEANGGHPTCDALITEGEKKALKACLEGFPTIALSGVWCFRDQWRDLHDDLFLVSSGLRSLTLFYDNDVSAKEPVALAANALFKSFADAAKAQVKTYEKEAKATLQNIKNQIDSGEDPPPKAKLRHISTYLYWSLLPHTRYEEKIGLDDLLIRDSGAEILRSLIDCRLPALHGVEVGSAKKGTLGVEYEPTFTKEPAGDRPFCKTLPKHTQEHLRRTLTVGGARLSGVKYIADHGAYIWNRGMKIWSQMSNDDFKGLPDEFAGLHGWKNRQPSLMTSCMNLLTCKPEQIDEFNPRRLIGFANGDLDPTTGKLLSIEPKHMLVSRLAVDWRPERKCPAFLRWLEWMWESRPDQIKLLQAGLRWTMEPKKPSKFGAYGNSLEAIFGLIGPAGRGKGSLLEILNHLLGEAASATLSLQDLEDPNTLRRVMGKQALIDPDQKGFLTERLLGTLNKLASNEPVSCKQLYRDVTQARLGTVIWFAANRMPRTPSAAEDNEGWHRRLVLLICDRKPPKREAKFLTPIIEELEGIIQWVWSMSISEAIEIISTAQEAHSPERVEEELEYNSIYLWLNDLMAINEKAIAGSLESDLNPKTASSWKAYLRVQNGRSAHEMQTETYPMKNGEVYLPHWKALHLDYLCWCEVNREKGFGSQRFCDQINLLGGRIIRVQENSESDRRVRYRVLSLVKENINFEALVTGG